MMVLCSHTDVREQDYRAIRMFGFSVIFKITLTSPDPSRLRSTADFPCLLLSKQNETQHMEKIPQVQQEKESPPSFQF